MPKIEIDYASEQRVENQEQRVSVLEDRMDRIERLMQDSEPPGTDPPVYGEISVSDRLQEAILDAGDKRIVLKNGVYPPIHVNTGTRIRSESMHGAVISGLSRVESFSDNAGLIEFPFTTPLHQHRALRVHGTDDHGNHPSERGLGHRRAMQPHLVVVNGNPLMPVYDGALHPGAFRLIGTAAKPEKIQLMLPKGVQTGEAVIEVGAAQQLVGAAPGITDVDGVELDGLKIYGAANTKTIGALNLPSESNDWIIKNTLVDLSSGEGVFLRGKRHKIDNVASNRHGIACFTSNGWDDSEMIRCGANAGGWKPGLDVLWHGGNKFTNSSRNKVELFSATNMRAAGFWLDIFNIDWEIEDLLISGAVGFGLHIEHNSKGSAPGKAFAKDVIIRNVAKFEGIGSGLQIQYNVTNWLLENFLIENCADGAVYYKKEEDRGFSGSNVFRDFKYQNNGNNNRFLIQGDMNHLPDTFDGLDSSSFILRS